MSISGKTLVFTGTLTLQRAEATKMATDAGAKVTAAVSGKTDILVAGPGAGSKVDAAEAKGVAVWTEEQFIAACKGKKTKASAAKAQPAAKKARTTKKKEESEEEEEEEAKPAKRGAKKGKKAESEEEEEAPKAAPKKGRAASKKGKKVESEEEEEEEEAPKPAPKKGRAAAKNKKVESEEEEEEAPKPAPKKGRAAKKGKKAESEEEEEEAPKAEEKQVVTAVVKQGGGGFPVDSLVPNRVAYKVHENYAVKLNQTNIGGNNNKYYIIQLLNSGGSYSVWTRWGRVGEPGQNKLDRVGNLHAAIKGFEKKFREKTQNSWADRANFRKVSGKYELVEVEEGEEGGADDVPLGKLSKPQIEKGQAVLKDIEAAIIAGKKHLLNDLSSKFFSLIPTNFGRKRPEPIVSLDVLHAKEALLEFYLRMGFEDMKEEKGMAPIAGVMDIPLPATLKDAAKTICSDADIMRCVTKGHELATKQVGKPKKSCSGELYASILLYTSNAIYAALNKALRDENRGAVKKYFTYLRLFLEAFDVLPQQSCQLWRGIGVDLYDQYKVGSTITWWSVSSCTSDEAVARGFAAGCGGNCTMITLKAKTACDISQITFYAHEKESLLAPGTQLKILESKKVGKITEILVEEVGRCLK